MTSDGAAQRVRLQANFSGQPRECSVLTAHLKRLLQQLGRDVLPVPVLRVHVRQIVALATQPQAAFRVAAQRCVAPVHDNFAGRHGATMVQFPRDYMSPAEPPVVIVEVPITTSLDRLERPQVAGVRPARAINSGFEALSAGELAGSTFHDTIISNLGGE